MGGGGIKYHFFPKFKIVHIILGGGGQENYGLFPQFGTFFFVNAPLKSLFLLVTRNSDMSLVRSLFEDNVTILKSVGG